MNYQRSFLLVGMVAACALYRLLPHPWNFTPVGAMGLFAGATLRDRRLAVGVPLAAMLLSDLVLGYFGWMSVVVYASIIAYVVIGRLLQHRRRAAPIAATSLAGSIQFFLVTNFAVWALGMGKSYPLTGEGLWLCYLAGLPFFQNTVAGDLVFSGVLFGALALAERWVPALREPTPTAVTA